jgi:hypothetical protein
MIVREFLWQCSLLTVQFVQDSFVRELFYLDKYFLFCIDDYSRSHIHYMHLEIINDLYKCIVDGSNSYVEVEAKNER